MVSTPTPSSLRPLLRIAAASTAIGFGSVTGSLYSLRQAPSGMTFVFSTGSVVAFIVGAVCGWLYWRLLDGMIRRVDSEDKRRASFRLIVFNVAACLVGLVAFLYPIRFVRPERMREVIEGMGAAFLVLALVGFALWRVIRFLNEDASTEENEDSRD